MTREHKLALLIGFALVLVVGVVVSDHFSGAHTSRLADMVTDEGAGPMPTVAGANQMLSSPLPVDRPAQDPGPALAGRWSPTSAGEALGDVISTGLTRLDKYTIDMGKSLSEAPPTAAVDSSPAQPTGAAAALDPPADPITTALHTPPPSDDKATRAIDARVAFPTHMIKKGDTLWTIAQEHYGDAHLHTKLEEFNKGRVGEDGALYPGATLLIPPRDVLLGKRKPLPSDASPQVAAKPEPLKAATKPEPAKAAPPARSYTVKSGDTLAVISQRTLGTAKRWKEIADLNKLSDPDVVVVGAVLKIPAK